MGWLMARTTCSVKIWCMGSYDMIAWCDQCRRDNHVDHHEIREVQVHVMAWWHRDDGVMQSARINVARLRSDRTLDYKTRCGFRVIIESLTAQHNTHPTPTLLHFLYHVYDQLLPIPHSPRWCHLSSLRFEACAPPYWEFRLSSCLTGWLIIICCC